MCEWLCACLGFCIYIFVRRQQPHVALDALLCLLEKVVCVQVMDMNRGSTHTKQTNPLYIYIYMSRDQSVCVKILIHISLLAKDYIPYTTDFFLQKSISRQHTFSLAQGWAQRTIYYIVHHMCSIGCAYCTCSVHL